MEHLAEYHLGLWHEDGPKDRVRVFAPDANSLVAEFWLPQGDETAATQALTENGWRLTERWARFGSTWSPRSRFRMARAVRANEEA